MINREQQAQRDGLIYLGKILGGISFFLLLLFTVILPYFSLQKVEGKIEKRFSSVGITFSDVTCSGYLSLSRKSITGADCIVKDFFSPSEVGMFNAKKLTIFDIQFLDGIDSPQYSGLAHLNLDIQDLSVTRKDLSPESASIVENVFNKSNLSINMNIQYSKGVGKSLNILEFKLVLPKENTNINISGSILSLAKDPILTEATFDLNTKSFDSLLFDIFNASILGMGESNSNEFKTKYYGKVNVSKKDVYSNFVGEVKKMISSKQYIEYEPLYVGLISENYHGSKIEFRNNSKTLLQKMFLGFSYGDSITEYGQLTITNH